MAFNFDTTRAYLHDFKFKELFIEILGWSNPKGIAPIELVVEEVQFTITPISQLAGVVVFEASAESGILPNAKIRAAVHKETSKLHHENLLIFLDEARTQSLWYWTKREGSRTIPRNHLYVKGQPGDLFLGKISSMVVDISELDENGDINVLEVARRLQKALDVQQVTKKFYNEFAEQRLAFVELIQGIDDDHDRRWYASVLLNRLMFIYFLQRKEFLNNRDMDYLQTKLAESQARGEDHYYNEFLIALFFEGFAKPEDKRSEQARKMLGKIRYLNGGLFLPHPVEQKYQAKIFVPDLAFENLLKLFSDYSWNLDDTPGGDDKAINPDVLGYIFEKYINQKAFGAYYTRPEITEYLCEQTIHRLVLDKVNTPGLAGVVKERNFEKIEDLLTNLDAQLCKQLLFETLPKISILDPASGSGAFLVAAMRTLINIYSAVTGKIDYLGDKALSDWLEKTKREHPSIAYFIKRRIITDNLFGVDIMDEAAEIARLRLFLALVSSVQKVEELEPLPNIDFNIVAGNSLIGMLRVNEEAFNQRLGNSSSFEQGSFVENYKQGGLFQQKTYRQIVNEKRVALDAYRNASSFTEDLLVLRETIQARQQDDYALLNGMLVDEFKELKIKYVQATWDERKHKVGRTQKRAVQLRDIEALQPFHWGYEFDEVMNERGGFDVIITNPPWDIFKPHSKEFFAEYSDLVTMKKMTLDEFEKEKEKLLKQTDLREAWLEFLSRFPHVSMYYRSAKQFVNQISIVNGRKVGSDINLYKLFVEQCQNLLKPKGCCGMVVPSGIYTDLGTKQLREMLFGQTLIMGLFCFENKKEIFENVDSRFKFVVLTFEKGGSTREFVSKFMRHNVEELVGFPENDGVTISVATVRKLAPDSLSITEIKSNFDAQIIQKMSRFPLLGEEVDGKWLARFSTEFHITNDRKYFNENHIGLPLYQGRMIFQYEANYDEPKFWIQPNLVSKKYISMVGGVSEYEKYRLAFRGVASSTNERTLISTILQKNVFAEVQLPVIDVRQGEMTLAEQIYLSAVCNSYCTDFSIRNRVSTRLSNFHIYQTPIPRLSADDLAFAPIVERAAKLICTTPEFDELAEEVGLGSHENGVTDPEERAQLRAELDGMIAHLYNLTEEEFAHILSTFPIVKDEVKSAAMEEFRKMAPNPELMALIMAGETDKVEFKVGAIRNPRTGKKDDSMMLNILQEVACFMNTDGGTLLVGVDDDRNIQGIDVEYSFANPKKQNWDGYMLNLIDRLKRLSIPNASQYCKFEKFALEGKDVCQVTVQHAPEPVYVEDKFYIREGNRKRELPVREAHDYIVRKWK